LREPCRPKAAGGLELVGLAQGKVILAGSTFRREKMRLDPRTGTSITAQSRCSSRSLPPLIAHKRPALPRWSRGRLGAQPNRAIASQPKERDRRSPIKRERLRALRAKRVAKQCST
jgi:hypothetical protein